MKRKGFGKFLAAVFTKDDPVLFLLGYAAVPLPVRRKLGQDGLNWILRESKRVDLNQRVWEYCAARGWIKPGPGWKQHHFGVQITEAGLSIMHSSTKYTYRFPVS